MLYFECKIKNRKLNNSLFVWGCKNDLDDIRYL